MFHANDRNAPHWSADFVEHIRTVDFALVAVCLGLTGLLQFQKPTDVSIAQSQLEDIRAAVDKWDPLAIGKSITKEYTDEYSIILASGTDYFFVQLPLHLWLPSDNESEGRDRPKITLDKPHSLSEFKSMWDALASLQMLMPDFKNLPSQLAKILFLARADRQSLDVILDLIVESEGARDNSGELAIETFASDLSW